MKTDRDTANREVGALQDVGCGVLKRTEQKAAWNEAGVSKLWFTGQIQAISCFYK